MKKFLKSAAAFLIIAVAIISVVYQPELLAFFAIGAVLETGILGKVSGKVANVVGGTWKGINYVRAYFVPANPNTADQQEQRSKMRAVIFFARQLTGAILQPYWDKFAVGMSGFNRFVSTNIMEFVDPTFNVTDSMKTALGTMLGVADLTCEYTTANGNAEFTWTNNTNGSTGLVGDVAVIVIAHQDGTVHYAALTAITRGDGGNTVVIDSGLTAGELIGFVFFTRGTGSALDVSDSSAVVATAP